MGSLRQEQVSSLAYPARLAGAVGGANARRHGVLVDVGECRPCVRDARGVRRIAVVVGVVVVLVGGLVRADEAGGAGGGEKARTQGSRVLLDDEPDWNGAEEATAGGQWDSATDGYLKVLRTTQKAWLKTRAALRILDVAPKAHRYEAVVTGYLSLVRTDAAQALSHRPALPEADSAYVDTALSATEKVLAEPSLGDDQKQALLSFQLDLYRIRKDDARADEVLKRLNEVAGASTAPGSAKRFADAKLTAARVAFDRRDYSAAAAAVATAGPAITDPGQQEDALFLLAKALDGQAASAGDSAAGLKDAGLAYMRVVAHFQDAPGNRHVAEALAGCGSVLERLGETKIAADLYEQAAIQYDTRPEARAARDRAARLRDASRQ